MPPEKHGAWIIFPALKTVSKKVGELHGSRIGKEHNRQLANILKYELNFLVRCSTDEFICRLFEHLGRCRAHNDNLIVVVRFTWIIALNVKIRYCRSQRVERDDGCRASSQYPGSRPTMWGNG